MGKYKKAGPRDIGRIHPKNSDWTPLANADKVLSEQQKKGFLDSSMFKSETQRRMRASSSMLLRRKDGPPRTPKRSKKEKEKKRENVQKLGLTISKSMDSEKIQINKAMTPSPSRNGLKYNEEMGRNKKRKKRSPKKRSSGKRSSGKKKNERRHRRDRSYSNDDDLDEKQIVFGTIKRSRSKSGTRGRT